MEPITTIAMVYAGAQTAVEGIKKAVALGKEIREVYGELSSFFHAQGKIESEIRKQEFQQVVASSTQKKSVTQQALDTVFMRREMFRMEVELREMLIYQFNEAGLYEEMCAERDRIIAKDREAIEEAQRAATEALLAERRRLREIKKAKQARMALIVETIAVVMGVVISLAICYGIWWMFHYAR
jgi:hypothetical protein